MSVAPLGYATDTIAEMCQDRMNNKREGRSCIHHGNGAKLPLNLLQQNKINIKKHIAALEIKL